MTKEEYLAAIAGDIDPMKYAGEGWFATEEYARPGDIKNNPQLRNEIGGEGEYYPEAEGKPRIPDSYSDGLFPGFDDGSLANKMKKPKRRG
jgi:hypothetical protein